VLSRGPWLLKAHEIFLDRCVYHGGFGLDAYWLVSSDFKSLHDLADYCSVGHPASGNGGIGDA